jgi:hypothetical protein
MWKTDAEIARTVEAIAGKRYPRDAGLARGEDHPRREPERRREERGDAAASRAER